MSSSLGRLKYWLFEAIVLAFVLSPASGRTPSLGRAVHDCGVRRGPERVLGVIARSVWSPLEGADPSPAAWSNMHQYLVLEWERCRAECEPGHSRGAELWSFTSWMEPPCAAQEGEQWGWLSSSALRSLPTHFPYFVFLQAVTLCGSRLTSGGFGFHDGVLWVAGSWVC